MWMFPSETPQTEPFKAKPQLTSFYYERVTIKTIRQLLAATFFNLKPLNKREVADDGRVKKGSMCDAVSLSSCMKIQEVKWRSISLMILMTQTKQKVFV